MMTKRTVLAVALPLLLPPAAAGAGNWPALVVDVEQVTACQLHDAGDGPTPEDGAPPGPGQHLRIHDMSGEMGHFTIRKRLPAAGCDGRVVSGAITTRYPIQSGLVPMTAASPSFLAAESAALPTGTVVRLVAEHVGRRSRGRAVADTAAAVPLRLPDGGLAAVAATERFMSESLDAAATPGDHSAVFVIFAAEPAPKLVEVAGYYGADGRPGPGSHWLPVAIGDVDGSGWPSLVVSVTGAQGRSYRAYRLDALKRLPAGASGTPQGTCGCGPAE